MVHSGTATHCFVLTLHIVYILGLIFDREKEGNGTIILVEIVSAFENLMLGF